VRLTTDVSRNVTSSNAPDAFGVASSTANTASAYLWNGGAGYRTENLAPLGLPLNYSFQKVGDRYYDPTMGCFLTRDTELGEKPYAYCDGDPVNFSDPSGHRKKKQPLATYSLPAPSQPGAKDGPPPPNMNLSRGQNAAVDITTFLVGYGVLVVTKNKFASGMAGIGTKYATQYLIQQSPVINYYMFHDGAGTNAFKGGMR